MKFMTKIAMLLVAIALPVTSLVHTTADAASMSADAKRAKIVQTAMNLKGHVNYVSWQNRQEKKAPYATDCSGFTALVYKLANVGVTLVNRDDDDQAKVGTKVGYGNFKKGDLLFFWNSGSKNHSDVGHVGIYIGDGKMIHNASPSADVIVSSVNSSYYKTRFIVGRRVIK
jgi:cell wall-associated NlpC family hydrolase